MPTYLPQVHDGVLSERPYSRRLAWRTSRNVLPDGRQHAWSHRASPLGRWTISWSVMTDAELAILENFWASVKGRLGEFSFLDPGGNLVLASEDFADASWTQGLSVGAATGDPFGGSRARAISGVGAMSCTLIASGASGFILCGSIYAKPAVAASITLALKHSGTAFATRATAIAAGAWVRALVGGTAPGAGAVTFEVTLPGGSWTLFGAQAAPSPGPGAYARTPGSEALRARCRFASEGLSILEVGPSERRIEVDVVEFA